MSRTVICHTLAALSTVLLLTSSTVLLLTSASVAENDYQTQPFQSQERTRLRKSPLVAFVALAFLLVMLLR